MLYLAIHGFILLLSHTWQAATQQLDRSSNIILAKFIMWLSEVEEILNQRYQNQIYLVHDYKYIIKVCVPTPTL